MFSIAGFSANDLESHKAASCRGERGIDDEGEGERVLLRVASVREDVLLGLARLRPMKNCSTGSGLGTGTFLSRFLSRDARGGVSSIGGEELERELVRGMETLND